MKKLIVIIAALLAYAGIVHAKGDWDFRLSPYGWFAGVKGNASTIPGAPVVPIEVTPSEALSDSRASAMLIFEAKKGKHGAIIDLIYTDSESGTTLIEAINLNEREEAVAEEPGKFPDVAYVIPGTAIKRGAVPDNALIRAVRNNYNPARSGNVYVEPGGDAASERRRRRGSD
jgi:hypothetical protein